MPTGNVQLHLTESFSSQDSVVCAGKLIGLDLARYKISLRAHAVGHQLPVESGDQSLNFRIIQTNDSEAVERDLV